MVSPRSASSDASLPAFVPPPNGRYGLRGSPEPIAALNRVRITEYLHPWTQREPLVDVRIYCPEVSFVESLCPYLRRTVADMLNRAQSALPSGYRLRAGTCLRTLAMQKGGWDGYFKRMKQEHPDWPLSALRRAVNKYFAPYDQKAPPGHTTGGAVDVGLLDPQGVAPDMTAPTKGWEGAYTWSDKIGPEAKGNRMRMVEVMLAAGFSNCRDEFWHYSWGDSAWAARVGETECPYGWAHPPVALEAKGEHAPSGLEIETVRDVNGRALRAEAYAELPDVFERTEEGVPRCLVGLYWASGVPVTLRIRWPETSRGEVPLFLGEGKEQWTRLEETCREGETLLVQLTPAADRVVLSSFLPPSIPPQAGGS